MDKEKALTEILKVAVSTLRRHNAEYHWRTPEETIDLMEKSISATEGLDDLVQKIKDNPGHYTR